MKILITGTAGFIGYHLANRLLELGHQITGIDNINDYYETDLKYARLASAGIPREQIAYGKALRSVKNENYSFIQLDLVDRSALDRLFADCGFDAVVNLAAQAGVRYSVTNPESYIESNVVGFFNILECCRNADIQHLLYASSSSVYGADSQVPFTIDQKTDTPLSLYAATKKSNELMAYSYSSLYGFQTTGFRFFTVYGPWGRPDMAYFLFANRISSRLSIDVFNFGDMERDFTYIDDIIEGVVKVIQGGLRPATERSRVYNIGNNSPVKLMDFISLLEEFLEAKALLNFKPIQPGEVHKTWANTSNLQQDYQYRPSTDLRKGIAAFVSWYKSQYITHIVR